MRPREKGKIQKRQIEKESKKKAEGARLIEERKSHKKATIKKEIK